MEWMGLGSVTAWMLVFIGNSPLSQESAFSPFGHSDLGNVGPSQLWPPIMAVL